MGENFLKTEEKIWEEMCVKGSDRSFSTSRWRVEAHVQHESLQKFVLCDGMRECQQLGGTKNTC